MPFEQPCRAATLRRLRVSSPREAIQRAACAEISRRCWSESTIFGMRTAFCFLAVAAPRATFTRSYNQPVCVPSAPARVAAVEAAPAIRIHRVLQFADARDAVELPARERREVEQSRERERSKMTEHRTACGQWTARDVVTTDLGGQGPAACVALERDSALRKRLVFAFLDQVPHHDGRIRVVRLAV